MSAGQEYPNLQDHGKTSQPKANSYVYTKTQKWKGFDCNVVVTILQMLIFNPWAPILDSLD